MESCWVVRETGNEDEPWVALEFLGEVSPFAHAYPTRGAALRAIYDRLLARHERVLHVYELASDAFDKDRYALLRWRDRFKDEMKEG